MSVSYCSLNNETEPFSTLAAEISILLPEVAEPVVNAAIFRASVEFLSKTRVLRDVIEIDFQRHTEDYPIEPADCHTVLSVNKVFLNDIEVEDYQINGAGWLILPECYLSACDGSKIKVHAVLGISKEACTLPQMIYERYGDGIMNMAVSRLYGMHGEDWYDPNLIRFYGGIGRQSIADAKTLVDLENNKDCITVRGTGLLV